MVMDKKQLKILFNKYINNECTDQEIKFLENYLDSFQDKDNLLSELTYDAELKEKIWLKIRSNTINKKEVKSFSIKPYLKYAAILTGLFVGLLWYQFNPVEVKNPETITGTDITIKSSNNTTTAINVNGSKTLVNDNGEVVASQKGTQISYIKNEEISKLVFNEIFVPNGKKAELLLSDGTMVHMNSGSSLKFPVNFIRDKKREVFLEGEAYFEVAKNPNNPFVVSANNMLVQVLGTHFNVSAFKNQKAYAVLAEGSIAVNKNQNDKQVKLSPKIMVPGEKAIILNNEIEISKVDVYDYLSWRDGVLAFNDEPFVDIIKKIERQYGVIINNECAKLNPMRFKGTFTDETILELLDTFKESASFKYEINNNNITLYDENEDLTKRVQ